MLLNALLNPEKGGAAGGDVKGAVFWSSGDGG